MTKHGSGRHSGLAVGEAALSGSFLWALLSLSPAVVSLELDGLEVLPRLTFQGGDSNLRPQE